MRDYLNSSEEVRQYLLKAGVHEVYVRMVREGTIQMPKTICRCGSKCLCCAPIKDKAIACERKYKCMINRIRIKLSEQAA